MLRWHQEAHLLFYFYSQAVYGMFANSAALIWRARIGSIYLGGISTGDMAFEWLMLASCVGIKVFQHDIKMRWWRWLLVEAIGKEIWGHHDGMREQNIISLGFNSVWEVDYSYRRYCQLRLTRWIGMVMPRLCPSMKWSETRFCNIRAFIATFHRYYDMVAIERPSMISSMMQWRHNITLYTKYHLKALSRYFDWRELLILAAHGDGVSLMTSMAKHFANAETIRVSESISAFTIKVVVWNIIEISLLLFFHYNSIMAWQKGMASSLIGRQLLSAVDKFRFILSYENL